MLIIIRNNYNKQYNFMLDNIYWKNKILITNGKIYFWFKS
jgi:hypothetical protein